MTTNKKPAAKRVAADWRSPGSPHELPAAEQLAHAIITERPDLVPSVERIMIAPLDTDGRQRALALFRDSLTTPGDVHRDPRVAIASCLPAGGAGTAGA